MDGLLKDFVNGNQIIAIVNGINGEEKQFFIDKMSELKKIITEMPELYGQDGKGEEAIAYLHYFNSSFDWYITEKDITDEQLQAFGLACMQCKELGYISIQDVITHGGELDLHWTPKTLREVREQIKARG